MTKVVVEGFAGVKPVIEESLLQDHEASSAQNLRIQGGKITSLKTDLSVRAKTVAGTLKSFYEYVSASGNFFEWASDVDCVTSQIGADAYNRRIFTGDTHPKVTYTAIATSGSAPYPVASYLLGTPPPGYVAGTYPYGQAITLAVTGTPDDPLDIAETRFYIACSVDIFGAEGPPNLVSASVDVKPGEVVNATIPAKPVGNYNITGWNLYRTATGSTATDFQFVKSGTTWSAATADSVPTEDLGEVITTENYNLPDPGMVGITAMPGAFLAGFKDNIVYFSEPGFPHAWPISYQINTKYDIVGIKVVGQNMLLVTTKENPYIISGTDPNSMSLSELDDVAQACVSKRSMCDVGSGVVYASPDGLMLITTGGTSMLTEGIFSQDQWQALVPSSMSVYAWERLALVFYDLGTGVKGGFIISPQQPQAGVVWLDTYADGGYSDPLTDTLYLSIDGYIVKWTKGTTYRTGTWASKQFERPHPMSLSTGRAWGNSTGALTLDLADENEDAIFSTVVRDELPFRLSGGQKTRGLKATLTLTGGKDLHRLELAESMKELRGR